jgi:phosphate:Na+ symporter
MIDWFSLITGILGGLVFFLYGMNQMSAGLKSGLGDKIRSLITKLNSSSVTLMFTGILVTVITQSTGATTVMLMSFVETNIMQFAETVPVILGACIGSSVTSQIIAFDVAGYSIVPVIIGYFMKSSSKDSIRDAGNAIFGFGLVFFGMQFLGKAVSVLKDIPEFTGFIAGVNNPIVGLLVGTIATCIMQSTGMFAGILMVFAREGLIGIEQAYPLVVGSTLGTCLLIVIASVGTSTQGKRTMAAHVLTKVVGAFLFMLLMPLMVSFIQWFTDTVESSPERSIANVHLFFNVGEALLLLPFSNVFVKVIEKYVSTKKSNSKPVAHLRYIDFNVIAVPQSAMELSISETATIIKLCSRMFDRSISPFIDYDPSNEALKKSNQKVLSKLDVKEKKLKYIEEEVRRYLFTVGRGVTAQSTTRQIFALLSVLEQTARIVEVVRRSLVPLYSRLCIIKTGFSVEGMSEIKLFTWEITNYFHTLISAIENRNAIQIKNVYADIEQTRQNAEDLRISHFKRLWSDETNVRMTHEIHTELIDNLAEIASIMSSIAYSFQKSILTSASDK